MDTNTTTTNSAPASDYRLEVGQAVTLPMDCHRTGGTITDRFTRDGHRWYVIEGAFGRAEYREDALWSNTEARAAAQALNDERSAVAAAVSAGRMRFDHTTP